MPKLNDTQLVILSAAARRQDGAVLPLPKSLRIKGGAVTKKVSANSGVNQHRNRPKPPC